jgi:hypothetical protein
VLGKGQGEALGKGQLKELVAEPFMQHGFDH